MNHEVGQADVSLRLSFVVPSLRAGLRYWNQIISALTDEGMSVKVFTGLPPDGETTIDLQCFAARYIHSNVGKGYPRGVWVVSPRLILGLLRSRPDLIIAVEYGMATMLSLLAARLSGGRVAIFHEHAGRIKLGIGSLRLPFRRWMARIMQISSSRTLLVQELN